MDPAAIAVRHEALQKEITAAAQAAGRDPAAITLVAVTKTWSPEVVVAAHAAGLRHFGENRPEELANKRPAVTAALGPDHDITWHLIGTVQSRKTSLVVAHADVFHALDRLKIARRLSRELTAAGRVLPLFLEVNVSGEASKAGFDCRDWESDESQRRALCAAVNEILRLPGLDLQGLMTMAPWEAPAPAIRAVFERTRDLAHWLAEQTWPGAQSPPAFAALSMGMTDDFPLAIAAGATHIRVGRALFGPRPAP